MARSSAHASDLPEPAQSIFNTKFRLEFRAALDEMASTYAVAWRGSAKILQLRASFVARGAVLL